MADYYADSSVLVKRHVQEIGTAWFQALAEPSTGNSFLTSRVSVVEVLSTLNRQQRETKLSETDYTSAANDFVTLCTVEYAILEVTPRIVARTRLLLEHHVLRAYDAIQLASALVVNNLLQSSGSPALTFLAADRRLLTAAQAEGLVVDDPNIHA